MKFFKYILFIFIMSITMSCGQSTKDIQSIKDFDSQKYLGKWYEIARLDHNFERGLDYVTATYSIKDNGKIKVLNQGINSEGRTSTTVGKAYVKDTKENLGELRVSFFWIFYAKYRIIYLDKEYETAIVTSGKKKYLWILARKPILEKDKLDELISFCKKKGYNTEKLIFPKQK